MTTINVDAGSPPSMNRRTISPMLLYRTWVICLAVALDQVTLPADDHTGSSIGLAGAATPLEIFMNRIAVLALAAALNVAGPAIAQQPAAPQAVAKTPAAPNAAEFDKQLSRLQDHFKQMQSYMERMQTTQDPQERQKLIQQHWDAMQAGMNLMHGTWGPGQGYGCCGGPGGMGQGMGPGMMMGPMMGWDHMRGYYSGLNPDQLRQRQYMMDQYVPMQNMMMNHMMWHQQWQRLPAPAK